MALLKAGNRLAAKDLLGKRMKRQLTILLALAASLAFAGDTADYHPAKWYIDHATGIYKTCESNGVDLGIAQCKACDYLEKTISCAEKLQLKDDDIIKLYRDCLSRCWTSYLDKRFEKYYEGLMKFKPDYRGDEVFRARQRVRYNAIQDAKRFPLDEKEINFGQTLSSMGIVEKKTVALKDHWNPTNVTAALQKLIDDPEVTTIVLDKMETPWYITTVTFDHKVTGKRLLLKSGCKVLRCPETLRHRVEDRGGSMFEIKSAQNIIIESDAEKPEDVLIGYYESRDERLKWNKKEGRSGVAISHENYQRPTRNIVIRNLRIADCECDGISLGPLWDPCEEIFIEDVILDSNFRQGCSPCAYYSLYFKNVQFTNTRGGQPMAGCDVEPWDDYLSTVNLYFFDCTFANNGGGGLLLATTTHDPVLCLLKRCTFKPTYGSQISVIAMPISYFRLNGRPYSDIRIEDCTFESRGTTLSFNPCPVYNFTMKNCLIRDARSEAEKKRAKKGPSPISISLSRDFGNPDYPSNVKPEVVFDNVTIEGFENSEPLTINDEIGMMNIKGVFRGKVNWNGKKVNLSKISYNGPDIHEPKTQLLPAAKLLKPVRVAAAGEMMPTSNAKLCFNGAWWLKCPRHSYYFWAEKGRDVSFDIDVVCPSYWKKFPTNTLYAVSAEGAEVKLADVSRGKTSVTYTAPDTGWHRITPGTYLDGNGTFNSGIEYYLDNFKGAFFAWQADAYSDCFAKFLLKDGKQPYTGYFEVPAGGRECRLRVSFGGFTLKDPAGNIIDSVTADDYRGRYVFTIKPSTDKAEIWSFTTPCTPDGGFTRGLRFYAPLNGIWADSPNMLPCEYAEHFVPEKKATSEIVTASVKLDTAKFPPEMLKALETAKTERKTFAAKKEYANLQKTIEDQIAKMRTGKMTDDLQHQIDDLTRGAKLHGRVAAMEAKAAAEPADVFATAAFCQAFLPVIALDAQNIKDFAAWKTSEKPLAEFSGLERELASPYLDGKIQDRLHDFKLDNPEGVLEYDTEANLAAFADALLIQLGLK